jgi:hypothetical protein
MSPFACRKRIVGRKSELRHSLPLADTNHPLTRASAGLESLFQDEIKSQYLNFQPAKSQPELMP